MDNKEQTEKFETEVLAMDEIVNSRDNLPSKSHNFSWYTIVSGVLVPVVDSVATPYYKKQIIDAQKEIAFNKMVVDERKYREVLNLIRDLSTSDNIPPSLKEELIKELLVELRKLNK